MLRACEVHVKFGRRFKSTSHFPLSGFFEVRFSESLKRVVYESVELSQEYRCFNFESAWLSK